jgi:hypothetical protein
VGQDQLFKTILEAMLRDFLELFFPDEAARLDFDTLRFLGKEVFANVPEGEVREADVVARLETLDGQPELVLVHVEVQAEHRSEFARRIFEYYAVLRLHYRVPVFPIVLYLRGGPLSRIAEYREDLFGRELLTFRYHSVALARLPAEEYVGTSPLGAALSALMSSKKGRDRAALMASMLERVAGSGFNEALKYLLVNVIKTYSVLSDEDHERYRRLLTRKEFRAVQELELTWADRLVEKGREEGLERGREAGVIEGKRMALLRQLSAKFGEMPEGVTARAEALSESELDSVLDRILTATTLRELGLGE